MKRGLEYFLWFFNMQPRYGRGGGKKKKRKKEEEDERKRGRSSIILLHIPTGDVEEREKEERGWRYLSQNRN